MEGLNFANGLVLSPKEDFLLVLESGGQTKIWKYQLVGENSGKSEVFAIMPGTVDNIKPNGGDGYLLGIIIPKRSDGKDKIMHQLRTFYPVVRLLVRLLRILQLSVQFINDYILHSDLMETLGKLKISIRFLFS